MNGTYYLNNSGDRWVVYRNGKRDMPFILRLPDGTLKRRKADYYEAFGNFGAISFRYCGTRYTRLPADKIDGILVVNL